MQRLITVAETPSQAPTVSQALDPEGAVGLAWDRDSFPATALWRVTD